MAMFVHIADARKARAIARDGLKPNAWRGADRFGVYAMPVLQSYFVSHQWLRELKRRGMRTLVGVYFRVPDRERVLVGHYNSDHRPMTAAQATQAIMDADDARGYEVIVPREIRARQIHAVRAVSQVVGWRYFPGSHGRNACGCPFCSRGEIKSKRLRDAYSKQL
jgi:hypothetical protein